MLPTTRIASGPSHFSIPWLLKAALVLYILDLPLAIRRDSWLCQAFSISSISGTRKTSSCLYRGLLVSSTSQQYSSSTGTDDSGESTATTHSDNSKHPKVESGDNSTYTESNENLDSTSSANRKQRRGQKRAPTRTLYDVLGSSPCETKAEIKQRYVALAKKTHPDAIRGFSKDNDMPEFAEIAHAWQILSDKKERRRYDRKLRAEEFSRDIADFASKLSDEAAPQVRDLLDSIAVPFLRRTTATTLASFQAAAQDLSRKSGGATMATMDENGTVKEGKAQDLTGVFTSAMKAAHNAGRLVDNMELIENSEELERRVIAQIEEANKVKSQLEEVTVTRFRLALRTPNATFTSLDASRLLSYWNVSTSRSLLERVLLKRPVIKQVHDLKGLEVALTDKVGEYTETQSDYRDKERFLQNARAENVLAIQAEKRAREALALAQHRLEETTMQVRNATKELSQAGSVLEKVADESERLMTGLALQRELVRTTMQKKEEIITRGNVNATGFLGDEELKMLNLTDLEGKETELNEEYRRLEELANTLQLRANELKARAEVLKRTQ